MLGSIWGEGWHRSALSHQIGRWFTGDAPFFTADLFSYPDPQRYWPADAGLQLIQVPGELLLGPGQGIGLSTLAMLGLAGWATARLVRNLGASLPAALVAGLVVETVPFVVVHLQAAVLEPAALGFMVLAGDQVQRAVRAPSWTSVGLAGGATLLLAATSPYLAVYLALVCGFAFPFTWAWRQGWWRVALGCAVACMLALAPLLATGGGMPGRMDMERTAPPPPGASALGVDWTYQSQPLERALSTVPGGIAVLLATGLGLSAARGRRWTALGLVFFLGGPGVAQMLRAVGFRKLPPVSPLHELLIQLPVTNQLGNPVRLLAPWIVLATVGAVLSADRRRGVLGVLGVVAVVELGFTAPLLALPAAPVQAPASVLSKVDGPLVVFPSGHDPFKNKDVGAKQPHFYAGLTGQPVGQGHGFEPSTDHALQLALHREAGFRVSPQAEAMVTPTTAYEVVLVLEGRMDPVKRDRIRRFLGRVGAEERAQTDDMSLWWLPSIGLGGGSAEKDPLGANEL